MCVPKGQHKSGDVMVYFPADTLIPAEWADKFGVRKYLKGVDQDRVGRVKLRGEPSFGLVQPLPESPIPIAVGDNMAAFYGCKKYEPPIKTGCGDAAGYDEKIDPYFLKFTDVQNGRVFVDVLTEGEEVIFTEKIHGTNCRVGVVNGIPVAGSMEVRRKRPVKADGTDAELDSDEVKRSTYWFPFSIQGVMALLADTAVGPVDYPIGTRNVVLYGEVYGGSVQSLDYGIAKGKGVGFRAFGLRVSGKFLNWDDFESLCKKYGVETVPVLWRGPFSMAKAKELADGKSTMAGHIREGTVCYPVTERDNPKVGRAILKFIGTEYELSKHQEEDTKDI
jgi:RNA ligase (TIGR02306 family)